MVFNANERNGQRKVNEIIFVGHLEGKGNVDGFLFLITIRRFSAKVTSRTMSQNK